MGHCFPEWGCSECVRAGSEFDETAHVEHSAYHVQQACSLPLSTPSCQLGARSVLTQVCPELVGAELLLLLLGRMD